MNNGLQIFKNEEFGEVRTLIVNNEPWFVGKDICVLFGDKNHNRSLSRISDEDKDKFEILTKGGKQTLIFINESGLYSLLFSMQPQKINKKGIQDAYPLETEERIKKLKHFKRWVTHDVLPTIRKTGGYVQDNREEEFIKTYFPSFGKETQLAMVLDLRNQNEKLKNKNQQLSDKIEKEKPFVDFAKKVGNSSDLIDMNQMAKLLKDEHMDIGRNRLFEFLRNKGILRKNNEPYQRYLENGLFNVKESTYKTAYNTKVYTKTYVTGKGQIYITELLRRELSKNNNQKK